MVLLLLMGGIAGCTTSLKRDNNVVKLDIKIGQAATLSAEQTSSNPLQAEAVDAHEDARVEHTAFAEDAPAATTPHTVDYATVLELVSGENPQVAFAQERINEAFARSEQAAALWLPSLRAGVNYNRHDGSLQEVGGNALNLQRGAVFTGLGADAVGAASPRVHGLSAQFHVADAIFQPIIAERTTAAREYEATAITNDAMLSAAVAYVGLMEAVQIKALAVESLKNAEQLAQQTATFARSGQGAQADADRAQTELSRRKNEVTRSDEAIQVASARLAEILNLDPTIALQPAEPKLATIDLIEEETTVESLVETAKSTRPELSQRRTQITAAEARLNREKYAPLIPRVALGMSYGGFGAGLGSDIDGFRDRLDFDAVAYWEVRNLGVGERAVQDEMAAGVNQAIYREAQVSNRVAREVVEAHVQVKSQKRQIEVANAGIAAAEKSYERNIERIREGQGLPLEALQSLQALDDARREYVRAVSTHNAAQFRLHRAIGWPSE